MNKQQIYQINGKLTDDHMCYYKTDTIEAIGVGEIPIGRYLSNLCYCRKFNKDQIYVYTNDIYKIDLNEVLENKQLIYENGWENIYNDFEKENPRKREDDSTRKYFNNYGRKYFEQFKYKHFHDYNMVTTGNSDATVVHHIFPLSFGGDNSLTNLVHINEHQHEMFHWNPVQHIREANFETLDYMLHIFSNFYLRDIVLDYNLVPVFQKDPDDFRSIILSMLENKIKKFYKILEEKYSE